MLGLENHWGLGRTAAGVLRIVEAINSPWLQMTLDTGNFLEDSYAQMERMASSQVPLALVQAKTYFGGGRWYALDLDYGRHRRDPAQAQLPRLDLAGIRGQRGRRDRRAEEPGAIAEAFSSLAFSPPRREEREETEEPAPRDRADCLSGVAAVPRFTVNRALTCGNAPSGLPGPQTSSPGRRLLACLASLR